MTRLAVLASGSGTNLQAILDAAADSSYPAEVVLVLSDKLGCGALDRAERAGAPTEVVTWEGHGGDREAFTRAIVDVLQKHDVELVALAGFMRILTADIVFAFPNAVLNTHPSLLPSFRGAHGVEDALAAGVKVTGVTIHFVVPEVDSGPIIAQEPVRVEPNDTPETLHDRIKSVEHKLFPRVIAELAQGHYRVVDGRVIEVAGGGKGQDRQLDGG